MTGQCLLAMELAWIDMLYQYHHQPLRLWRKGIIQFYCISCQVTQYGGCVRHQLPHFQSISAETSKSKGRVETHACEAWVVPNGDDAPRPMNDSRAPFSSVKLNATLA